MALEIAEASVASDGHMRVAVVPTGNPKSVAILKAVTTKGITYSLTPSGFNRTTTENTIDDPRLTLRTVLSRPGTKTVALELQYVYGSAEEVARPALAEGTTGNLVARFTTANEEDWAIGQEADIIPFIAGAQRKDAPTANSVQTITQTIYVSGVPEDDAVLVA